MEETSQSVGSGWTVRPWWTLLGASFALAALLGFLLVAVEPFAGASFLIAPVCVVLGMWALRKRSLGGLITIVAGVAVPAIIMFHSRYLARDVRRRLPEYQSVLPRVLELDSAYCKPPLSGSIESFGHRCELRDRLDPNLRPLAHSVWVRWSDGLPAVYFALQPHSRRFLVYAPHWATTGSTSFYALGNGWFTTLPPP
jgi:hypothetical protein